METTGCYTWEINGNNLILTSEDGIPKYFNLCNIVPASVTPYIEAVLEDGKKLECNLKYFKVGEQKGFKEECRKSRSLFLNWLNWKKTTNQQVTFAQDSLAENADLDISSAKDELSNKDLKLETAKRDSSTVACTEEMSDKRNQLQDQINKVSDSSDRGHEQVENASCTTVDNNLENKKNDVELNGDDGSSKVDTSHSECLDKEVIDRELKVAFTEEDSDKRNQLQDQNNKVSDSSDRGYEQVENASCTTVDNNLENQKNDVKLNGDDGSSKVDTSHSECLDKEVIERKLKGNNVKVHIDNLMEPETNMNIRSINDEHVKELADAMLHSYDQYTTLVGMVSTNCSIENLHVPGSDKVQVLGGNHTRAALKLLQTKCELSLGEDYKYVRMDLYENLGQMQSLLLAYRHNDIHERAKPMSFQEKVMFFHRLWMNKNNAMKNKPLKTKASAWRSDIAIYTNKTKEGIKNAFKTHLNLASTSENTWKELEAVFSAFNRGELKNQKHKEELTQYPFFFFFRVKEECKRIELLRKLTNGEITLEEFRTICMSFRSTDNKAIEDETDKNECNPKSKVKKPKDDQIQRRKSKQKQNAEDKHDKGVQCLNENSDVLGQMEVLQKRLAEEETHNTCLKEKINKLMEEKRKLKETKEEESKQISDLTQIQKNFEKKVLAQEEMLKANAATESQLRRELEIMKCRAEVAEGAASRARAVMGDFKNKKIKPWENSLSNENTSADSKRPCTENDHALSKKRKTDDESNMNKVHENSNGTIKESSNSEGEKMDIAMVEYTNRTIYMGCLDSTKSNLTFAKSTVRQINNGLEFPELSLTLNQKDVQEINSDYIIKKLKCVVNNNKIHLSELQKHCLTKAFIAYAKKKMI